MALFTDVQASLNTLSGDVDALGTALTAYEGSTVTPVVGATPAQLDTVVAQISTINSKVNTLTASIPAVVPVVPAS